MKTLALLLFATSLLLTGCSTSTTGDGSLNTNYAAPDNLSTQTNLQELHSQALREGL